MRSSAQNSLLLGCILILLSSTTSGEITGDIDDWYNGGPEGSYFVEAHVTNTSSDDCESWNEKDIGAAAWVGSSLEDTEHSPDSVPCAIDSQQLSPILEGDFPSVPPAIEVCIQAQYAKGNQSGQIVSNIDFWCEWN
jgi:hypothetical protein